MFANIFISLKNKAVIFILLFFGVIYSCISIVNHYNFRTNAGDLGIYNQAIYDYAHFRFSQNTMWFGSKAERMLTAHFALIQTLISPLYWIFKSYTLVVFQIISVLIGGLGVHKYILQVSKNEKLSLLALVHFFSIWGIYSALAYDYHDSVPAAMIVPWILYYFNINKYKRVIIFFVLLIICRENMALWAGFIAMGLLVKNYKDKEKRNLLLGLTLFSFSFFVIVIHYIMPAIALQPDTAYLHFKFPPLGNNFKEAIVNIFKHPWDIFVAFFTNHLNNPSAAGVKSEFFLTLILSGGIALLRKPIYLFMLLPIFAQKLLHDTYTHWGLSHHYSIELAPILSIALFEWFSKIKGKMRFILSGIAIICCVSINVAKIENRHPRWFNNIGLRFYSTEHYKTPYNVKKIQETLRLIPKKAKVSAEFNLAPHLANRKYIYEYPKVFDAEYIVLCPGDAICYPLSVKDYRKNLKNLIKSYRWKTLVLSKDVALFELNETGVPPENEILKQIKIIDENEKWMEEMKKQSQEKAEPLERTIRKNAIYTLDQREKTLN